MQKTHKVEIEYCYRCRWLTRSAWMAQELLSTFAEELDEVSLKPAQEGGKFEIRHNGTVIWSRKEQQGFPEITSLKQLIRDRIVPKKDLGHADLTG